MAASHTRGVVKSLCRPVERGLTDTGPSHPNGTVDARQNWWFANGPVEASWLSGTRRERHCVLITPAPFLNIRDDSYRSEPHMTDSARNPLQFSILTLLILLCALAIPLALLSRVANQDAGLMLTFGLAAVVGSMYGLLAFVGWARRRTAATDASRGSAWKRPLLALLLSVLFLVGFHLFCLTVDWWTHRSLPIN